MSDDLTGGAHRDADEPTGTAIVLGATGQDGTLLTAKLLSGGWSAVGIARGASVQTRSTNPQNKMFQLVQGTITDQHFLNDLFAEVQPDAVFNVAGFTHVGRSWDAQAESREVNYVAVKKIVSAIELFQSRTGKPCHYYHSSSSEIFGGTNQKPQTEETPLNPATPYGEHKALAHAFLQNIRDSLPFATTIGILYNHESPLRPDSFVSRKISKSVAAIAAGRQDKLVMGNIESSRDWGFAGDYVEAMARLVATKSVGDFVIATGEERSVSDFIGQAFLCAGIENWEQYIEISAEYFRETDPNVLVGDASKIRQTIGWIPTTSFEQLVEMMVSHDTKNLN